MLLESQEAYCIHSICTKWRVIILEGQRNNSWQQQRLNIL
jgi:hypothetical protein